MTIEWPTEPPTEPPDRRPPPPPEEHAPAAALSVRLGAFLLDLVLIVCTFGFGWVGWWIITWADGQTPAKTVLHLHVVRSDDGRVASFGQMAIREAVGKALAAIVVLAGVLAGQVVLVEVVGVYVFAAVVVAIVDTRRRTLWDGMARTVVVEGDPPFRENARVMPVEASTAPS